MFDALNSIIWWAGFIVVTISLTLGFLFITGFPFAALMKQLRAWGAFVDFCVHRKEFKKWMEANKKPIDPPVFAGPDGYLPLPSVEDDWTYWERVSLHDPIIIGARYIFHRNGSNKWDTITGSTEMINYWIPGDVTSMYISKQKR